MTVSIAAGLVCDYATYLTALFSDDQCQSKQALLQPLIMDPQPVTVPNDNDIATVGAVFENRLFVFFLCVWERL